MSTARGTVKGSELFASVGQDTRRKVRSCTDCKEPNPPLPSFSDPDYCRACVGRHATRCTSCAALFTRDGHNTACPCCRDQVALFGTPA